MGPASSWRGLTCEGAAADAQVVVGELYAVQAALRAAGVGQALVDVPLTPLSGKARQAAAAVAPDLIHTLTTIEAVGPPGTVINVLFTKQAWGRGERELGPFWEPCSPAREGPLAATLKSIHSSPPSVVGPLRSCRAKYILDP